MCPKHCVNDIIAKPAASAVERITRGIEGTETPTTAPADAPHTINTYMKEAIHSEMTDLQNPRVRISTLIGSFVAHCEFCLLSFFKASSFSKIVMMW